MPGKIALMMTTIIVETSANTLKLQDFRRALLSDNGIPISAVPTGITEHQWCITGITTPVLFQEVAVYIGARLDELMMLSNDGFYEPARAIEYTSIARSTSITDSN